MPEGSIGSTEFCQNLAKTCSVGVPAVVAATEHVSVAVVVFVAVPSGFLFAWLLRGAAVPVLNQVISIFSNRKTSTLSERK